MCRYKIVVLALVFFSLFLTACFYFPATQPNILWREHLINTPDGQMHYLIYTKQLHLPPLILLNGFAMTSWNWPPQLINDLANHYTIYAIDYPGIGKNVNLYNKKFTFTSLADDINVLVKKIKQQQHVTKVRILGWSLGSMIAFRYANLYPKNVQKLFVIAGRPGGGFDFKDKSSNNRKVIATMSALAKTQTSEKSTAKLQKLLIKLMFPKKDCMSHSITKNICEHTVYLLFVNSWHHGRVPQAILARQRLLARDWNDMNNGFCINGGGEYNQCATLNVPIELIHGKQDSYINVENAKILHKQLHKSHLHLFDNAGHGIVYQYPGNIAALIR